MQNYWRSLIEEKPDKESSNTLKYFNVQMGFQIHFPSLDNSFVDRKEFYYKYYWTISYLLQNVTIVKPAPAPLKLLKVEQNCSLQYLPKKCQSNSR